MTFKKSDPGISKNRSSEPGSAESLFSGLKAGPADMTKTFLIRWIIFALIWWGLSAGAGGQTVLSMAIISLSAALSTLLVPSQAIIPYGALRFIPVFIHLSVLGGLDVATRAFRPSMPLKTGFVSYTLHLNHPAARILFVWTVSLLPGTASVKLNDQMLRIHVLDRELTHEKRLKELEQHIAGIFRHH